MGIGTDDNSKMVCYLIANGLGTPVKSKGNHLERKSVHLSVPLPKPSVLNAGTHYRKAAPPGQPVLEKINAS